MKKIILILLISINLYSNFSISGKSSSWFNKISEEYKNEEVKSNELYMTTMQINTDYSNDNFYFQSTAFGYIADTDDIKNPNFYNNYYKKEFFFRSLYFSYNIKNKITIGAGILPFSNSDPIRYNDDYIQDGEGINILNDNALTSVFAKYEVDNSRTIIGVGVMEPIIVPTGSYIDETIRDDTIIAFLINTYKEDKFELVSELLYTNMKYEGIRLSEIYLCGISGSWNDSEESGFSIYGSLGGSMYNNHNTEAKEAIFKNTLKEKAVYGDDIMASYPNNFAFGDKNYYGAAHLLGLRYDFGISKEEFLINGEWFHTYNDWSSGNQGNIYLPKNNQMFNIRDNSYYLNLGWIINNKMQLRLSGAYLEFDEQGKIGAPATTVPNEEYIGPKMDTIKMYKVIFAYKF